MRCPDCSRFVVFEEQDPEVTNIDFIEGSINGEVRLALNCAECGTELKETLFNFDADVLNELETHNEECHTELVTIKDKVKNIDLDNFEIDDPEPTFFSRTEGKGRGLKTFYGYQMTVEVRCTECDSVVATQEFQDDIQSSAMEELV